MLPPAMVKIALIGAGSVVFCKNLTGDLLSFPEFADATLAYMDIDRDRLDVAAGLCRKVARTLGARPTIEATTDLPTVLAGADFVINMVQVGGFDATLVDFEIPRKYGLNFTIADTSGPGGIFRALRTFPMLAELCRQMETACPRAVLLNYSNPMAMNMRTVAHAGGVRAVGLCHSVQGTLDRIAYYMGLDPRQVAYVCAGINHMAFYLRLEKDGHDLYPRLFDAMKDPRVYDADRVRFELMKRLGHFVTESSEHSAEYSAYFIPHGVEQAHKFHVPIDEYLRRCETHVSEFEQLRDIVKYDAPMEVHRSHEYGSGIIHSLVTGTPRVVYGNMPNGGTITNVPADAIVEAPTLVDLSGLRFSAVGELPPQLLGYIQPHLIQHELFIRAAAEGRRDHVYQACMFDPLTSARLTPDRIVEMCDEMIAAHGEVLPKLDATKTLVPSSGKKFPRVDPSELRKRWTERWKRSASEYLRDWHVIGPFHGQNPQHVSLDLRTPPEDDFRKRVDGSVELSAAYRVKGQTLKWRPVPKGKDPVRGFVDLAAVLGQSEWCVAYAYTDVQEPGARDALLRCGSDDGIRVWVNGQEVHSHDTGRAYRMDSDLFPVRFRAGVNRILVKITNQTGGWGFGVAIPPAGASPMG